MNIHLHTNKTKAHESNPKALGGGKERREEDLDSVERMASDDLGNAYHKHDHKNNTNT